jgi:glycosyltransferase involved in cell wall biosynthesis
MDDAMSMAEHSVAALRESPGGRQQPWVFVPTPGDHYSPCTGSANITRIYRLAEQHMAAGGEVRIIVGRNTRADTYRAGEVVRVDYPASGGKYARAMDVAMGHLNLQRRFTSNLYASAAAALPRGFRGTLFLYNEPSAAAVFRQRCPDANIVLYLGNQIWRMYTAQEAALTLRWVDHVICISEFLANDFHQKISNAKPMVHVIHNGAELNLFTPRIDADPNKEPVILFVGRMQTIKGPHLLIEAAKHLAAAGKRFKLRLVGSENFNSGTPITPYEQSLRAAAQPLGDRVEFQPFTDRQTLPAVFRTADIFCVPSIWQEPLGLVVLEGLAAGLPMLVTRRGGIPEIAGDAALYFDPTNMVELVQQIASLLDDAVLRRELGAKAREQAERWSWPNQYQKLQRAVNANDAMPFAVDG